jgi:hypothetical protein
MHHDSNPPYMNEAQRARMYEQTLLHDWRSDGPSARRKLEQARRKAIRRRLAPYWTVPLGVVLLVGYFFGNTDVRDFVSRSGWQLEALVGGAVVAIVMRRHKAGPK